MGIHPVANPKVTCRELYGDDWFVAFDKEAGRVTQPGEGHKDDSLLNGVFALSGAAQSRLGSLRDWGLLHRLDKDTSGVVIIARTKEAYDGIRAQFEARKVEKTYLAVVRGRLQARAGTCRHSLREERRGEMKVSVLVQRGEECVTHWRVLASSGNLMVVACAIETGKLHQIRAHMAYLGAPVEGDAVYRSLLPPNTSRPHAIRARLAPSLRLHAWRIAFAHPSDGRRIEIEAPPPLPMVDSMNLASGSTSASGAPVNRALRRELDALGSSRWWVRTVAK